MATASTTTTPRTVSEVMTANPRTCSKFSTVTEAVMIFKSEDCGLVPVVDSGQPIGVVTDRDIALALADHPDLADRPVSDIMTTQVVSVPENTSLAVAARTLSERGIRRLLVTDSQGMLSGVLAWADLAPHVMDFVTGRMVTDIVEQPPSE